MAGPGGRAVEGNRYSKIELKQIVNGPAHDDLPSAQVDRIVIFLVFAGVLRDHSRLRYQRTVSSGPEPIRSGNQPISAYFSDFNA
jgi:hypothetical protein